MNDEIFLISEKEFMILLAAKGIQDIYVLNVDQTAVDEAQLCYALSHLYQNGLIDSIEETFRIEKTLDTMLSKIKSAHNIWIVRQLEDELHSMCIYQNGSEFVVVETEEGNTKRVKIYAFGRERLLHMLELQCGQERTYVPVLEEKESYDAILHDKRSIEKERLIRFHNISFVLEKILAQTGELTGRFIIRHRKDKKEIVVKTTKEIVIYPFDKTEAVNRLDEMIGDVAI